MSRALPLSTFTLMVALALFAPAANAVSVDGIVTPGEYAFQTNLGCWVDVTIPVLDEDGNPVCHNENKIETEEVSAFMPGASLWLAQDKTTGDLSVAFKLDKSFVDNSYGETSIGWGKDDALSGKNHNFEDLRDSDMARFVFKNGEGKTVFDVTMDYLALGEDEDGNVGYIGGVTTGDEFAVATGSPDYVLDATTSLAKNWDTFGSSHEGFFGDGSDSPKADADYNTDDLALKDWIFDVTYEFTIDGFVFGRLDIEDLLAIDNFLTIPEVHASPSKVDNKMTDFTPLEPVPSPVVVPEPLTVFGLLAGLGGMAGYIRKRRVA